MSHQAWTAHAIEADIEELAERLAAAFVGTGDPRYLNAWRALVPPLPGPGRPRIQDQPALERMAALLAADPELKVFAAARIPDLAPRQQRFVKEYLLDLNATQAAIRAGYSPKTAEVQGSRLLSNAKVQSAIAARMAERSKRTEVAADRALLEIARLAFSDLRRLFHEDGRLKRPNEWDEDTAATVASVKVRTVKDGDGVAEVIEVRLWDKLSALERLGKHLGLFKETGDAMAQGHSERLTDLTEDELIERVLDRRARRAKWVEGESERATTRSPRL